MHDPAQTICHHLLPFLTMLQAQGSAISRVDERAWSNCLLNVALDKGPSIARASQIFMLPEGVTLWFTDDTHDDIENGLSCRECKHALSWPRVGKE
jgi:hypothetical protein